MPPNTVCQATYTWWGYGCDAGGYVYTKTVAYKGASAPGVNADFAIYPDSGYQTIVLSNRGHPHAVNVADYIGARLPLPQ